MFDLLQKLISPNSSKQYANISTTDAHKKITGFKKQGTPFLLLDVRSAAENASGSIEGSLNIPVQELSARMSEIEKHKTAPVIVYCHSGGRSAMASQLLAANGFSNVTNVVGGISDWTQKRLPVAKGR